ncbi:MAG: tetratricopeptide repeat protein [Gemmatimonadota bacterium]
MRLTVLVGELRRRHVFRVAAIYVVAAFAALQGASLLVDVLGLPAAAMQILTLIALVAFPVVLAVSWTFDHTPGGMVRTQSVDTVAATHESAAHARTAVAVLPFANLSGDAENEYFSDGMTEDILTHLSRINGLRVTSRTSVLRFKNTTRSLTDIANELRVGSVVEGSVRHAGNRVRITAQLIEAAGDRHLWAETYDRDLSDIFEVQSDVARKIASALRIQLTPAEEARLDREPTQSVEAYNLYLQARALGTQFSTKDLEQAVKLCQRALELDPNFVDAYAGIAQASAMMSFSQPRLPSELYPPAMIAARRALELDESSALAHASLAALLMSFEWDWPAAMFEFDCALELDPRNEDALAWKALLLESLERHDQAIEHGRRAVQAHPHSLIAAYRYGETLIMGGRIDEAVSVLERAVLLDQKQFLPRFWLATAYAAADRLPEAIAEFERVLAVPDAPRLWYGPYGAQLARSGRTAEARAFLQKLRGLAEHQYISPYAFFSLHLALGEVELALDECERLIEDRSGLVIYLRSVPRFKPLRNHPRFMRILRSLWPDDFPAQGTGSSRSAGS